MKPLREVAEAYMALAEAERQMLDGAYAEAGESCRRAMALSRTIPYEEAFDHDGFDAFCYASLSSAEGNLGSFEECLASADRALYYFNRRGELNKEDGKLWIKAVFSRAHALDALGRCREALGEFRKAGEMLMERKGELPGKEELRQSIELNIARLEAALPSLTRPGYKAWWEFWS
ncbi:MAG: DUF3856 domain-containing protein [Chlorobiaceae bacterium]